MTSPNLGQSPDDRLRDQVALVTGASRGIGRAIAITLAQRGVQVACVATSRDDLEHTVHACQAVGGAAAAFVADLRDLGQVEALVARVHEQLGPIDILINNAGVSARGKIQAVDWSDLERALDVNLRAVMRLTALVAPDLVRSERGALINIASIAGRLTMGGSAGYVATKHGVVGFSGSVFEDLREHRVKVCALCPGYVNTDLVGGASHVDPSRMIQPDDVAEAVLYVLRCNDTVCPTEIVLRPQRSPYVDGG